MSLKYLILSQEEEHSPKDVLSPFETYVVKDNIVSGSRYLSDDKTTDLKIDVFLDRAEYAHYKLYNATEHEAFKANLIKRSRSPILVISESLFMIMKAANSVQHYKLDDYIECFHLNQKTPVGVVTWYVCVDNKYYSFADDKDIPPALVLNKVQDFIKGLSQESDAGVNAQASFTV